MEKEYWEKGTRVKDLAGNVQVVIEDYRDGSFQCINTDGVINVYQKVCHTVIKH